HLTTHPRTRGGRRVAPHHPTATSSTIPRTARRSARPTDARPAPADPAPGRLHRQPRGSPHGRRAREHRTPAHRATLRRPAHRHRPRQPELPRRSTRRPGAALDPHPHHIRSGSAHQRRPHRPAAGDGVTVLAPSDDAFAATFSEDNWDDLMTHHTDQLRTLLKAHLITGAHPIADLTTAGTATTLDGVTVTVARTGPTARLGDRADTVCADYQATNARIHIIDAVLGPLPVTADGTGHRAH
ncbi:fasciclin domain-containing protein, partial [Micromonospora sp. STR1s_5]|nr:fasciclin domain-containing protein [Micromonospora sp. STR1s_5]